jgi:hypothetical protein
VAGSNSSSGFLHGAVVGEKVLAVATRSEDGNRAKCRVGIKPAGINKLKQGLRWGVLLKSDLKQMVTHTVLSSIAGSTSRMITCK